MSHLQDLDRADFDGATAFVVRAGAVLYDDFRALPIGTALEGRVSDSGHTWEEVPPSGNAWQVAAAGPFGNGAGVVGTNSFANLVADLGTPNVDLEALVTSTDNVRHGLCLRATNTGSGWGFYTVGKDASSSRGAISRIFVPTSGSDVITLLATFDLAGTGAEQVEDGDLIRAVASGSTITCYRNGRQVAQVVDSTYAGHRHGIAIRFTDDPCAYTVNVSPVPFPPETDAGRDFEPSGLGNYPWMRLTGAGYADFVSPHTWHRRLIETDRADVRVVLAARATSPNVTDLGPGIVVRHAPNDHRHYFVAHNGSDRFRIRKVDAAGGITDPIGSSVSGGGLVAFDETTPLMVTVRGDEMKVYQSGLLRYTFAMDPTYADFTRHGLGVGTHPGQFYDFEVRSWGGGWRNGASAFG